MSPQAGPGNWGGKPVATIHCIQVCGLKKTPLSNLLRDNEKKKINTEAGYIEEMGGVQTTFSWFSGVLAALTSMEIRSDKLCHTE